MSCVVRRHEHHPWSETFSQEGSTVFLEDGRGAWSIDRLRALAAGVHRALPAGPAPRTAVRSRSAAFVLASLLACWTRGIAPLLLDPDVVPETSWRGGLDDLGLTLVPAWEDRLPGDMPVGETAEDALELRLPSGGEFVLSFLTSGSTGAPKLVSKRDDQFQRQSEVEPSWLGLDGPIRTVSLVPAHHILGYIYGLQLPAATRGGSLFSVGASPYAWADAIRRHRPTLVVGVPLHYRLLAQALSEPLPEAVYVSSGGMLPAAVGDAFRDRAGWPIVQVYGSTEAAGIATRVGTGAWNAYPGLDWKAAARNRLAIRSPWQDRPGEWHVLDDAIEAAPEGGFVLLGRSDSVVKVGGRRYSLAEIVQAAQALADVELAHAITYSRYSETAVALFVVPRNGSTLTSADVRAFLSARLAGFKVPRTIRVVDELPSRGIGKVDDGALRTVAVTSDDEGSGRS